MQTRLSVMEVWRKISPKGNTVIWLPLVCVVDCTRESCRLDSVLFIFTALSSAHPRLLVRFEWHSFLCTPKLALPRTWLHYIELSADIVSTYKHYLLSLLCSSLHVMEKLRNPMWPLLGNGRESETRNRIEYQCPNRISTAGDIQSAEHSEHKVKWNKVEWEVSKALTVHVLKPRDVVYSILMSRMYQEVEMTSHKIRSLSREQKLGLLWYDHIHNWWNILTGILRNTTRTL